MSRGGGDCLRGVSVHEGLCPVGSLVQVGVSVQWGLSMVSQGVLSRRVSILGLCPGRGLCPVRGSLSSEVSLGVSV